MLYLIPTPVGNLEDITLRALRLLKEVDLVLAGRHSHQRNAPETFDIHTRLCAHHKFNEHQTAEAFAARIAAGENMALVTDAGTPGISDPGFMLVRACVEKGATVQCLPGPTAFVPALVASGLPCERFTFEGFLPQKKGRQTRLKELAEEPRTMIFYESPYRVVKTLGQFVETFGAERRCSACREISKIHEESVRGSLAEVLAHFEETEPRGEFVIIMKATTLQSVQREKRRTTKRNKKRSGFVS